MMLPQSKAAFPKYPGGNRGFTLVELLLVIAIISILSLAVTSVTGGSDRDRVALAAEQIRGQLDLARQTAISLGTHTYVALGTDTSSRNEPVHAAALQSLDGQPATGAVDVTTDSGKSRFALITRMQKAELVALEDTLDSDEKFIDRDSRLPDVTQRDRAAKPEDSVVAFTVRNPGTGSNIKLDWVIEFNPRGEATVRTAASSPAHAVAFSIAPLRGERDPLRAYIWITGSTGHTEVFE